MVHDVGLEVPLVTERQKYEGSGPEFGLLGFRGLGV